MEEKQDIRRVCWTIAVYADIKGHSDKTIRQFVRENKLQCIEVAGRTHILDNDYNNEVLRKIKRRK